MKARLIKGDIECLEGKVIAYIDAPHPEGFYQGMLAANSFEGFVDIFLQHAGKDNTYESKSFLEYLSEIDDDVNGIISIPVPIYHIKDITEKYECDILEVNGKVNFFIPKRLRQWVLEMRMDRALDKYFDACIDQDEDEEYPEPERKKSENISRKIEQAAAYHIKQTELPEYDACNRDAWKQNFSRLHDLLMKKKQDYLRLEQSLLKICTGAKIPLNLISEMCNVAIENHKNKNKLLPLYKQMIFHIEEEAYLLAKETKDKIDLYK